MKREQFRGNRTVKGTQIMNHSPASCWKVLSTVLALLSAVPLTAAGAGPLASLAQSEWGFPGEAGEHARFVQFGANNTVAGHLGCNRFTGGYTFRDGELKIGPLASTRMACLPERMRREQEFSTVLGEAHTAEASAAKLILKDVDGTVLAELVRRDAD